MSFKKIIFLILTILVLAAGLLIFNIYENIYQPNTKKTGFLYIPTGSNYDIVKKKIYPFLLNSNSFNWVAKRKNYNNQIKPGKYLIKLNMNNNDLVNLLRSGNQIPVKVSFNNQDSLELLAKRISEQIEADSLSLITAFNDVTFLNKNGFKKETAIAMYLPNTYEFYWNTSAVTFRNRMLKEYHNFWNNRRIKKAQELNLTPLQVATLASIVQKETATISERPKVAGLYLNRLAKNWPLQADPTIVFAIKQVKHQTQVKRVLTADLKIKSPYNTYLNTGLPPGPIGMADLSAIKSVLNPVKHQYYYMCASIDKIGQHEFSKTLREHNKYARKYQKWLSTIGIYR
ncbi:MAG: endolytic transglycosylase MltG [Lutibacter sp.]